jgi:hypothetical protein
MAFQQVYAIFVFAFLEKNTSRDSWRSPPLLEKKHVHAELHRGLCLWFDQKIPALWDLYNPQLQPFAIKPLLPLSMTLLIQIQLCCSQAQRFTNTKTTLPLESKKCRSLLQEAENPDTPANVDAIESSAGYRSYHNHDHIDRIIRIEMLMSKV